MIDKLFAKIKPTYIFNSLALGLAVISVGLTFMYSDTKSEILKINHEANIEYVQSLSKNLDLDISHILKKDFFSTLNDDFIAKGYVESNLNLFVSTKYKYIALVAKSPENLVDFIYLADSNTLNQENRFNSLYTPIKKEKYLEVYEPKKAVYFENKDTRYSWGSYLSPIIVDEHIEAIIVIKFSLEEEDTMLQALNKLSDMFDKVFAFFILVFIFILWFSYVDKKREQQKNIAFKKLQESNTNLQTKTIELKIQSDKIKELNNSLEDRVSEELAKNRAKDAHLIHQSRLAQMGEMISMIAHQWRQPLSSISATSTGLSIKAQLGTLNEAIIIEQTKLISQYTQHLSQTIDDFRNFFKPNKDKISTNYNELIQSVSSIIETSIKNKNIKLLKELDLEENFLSFPNELKQVILNLIKNSEDALVEGDVKNPYIKIITYKQDDSFILEVHDNAGGVPEDIIAKIFNPYFSTKLKKEGTGLGLYMSKMIIEEHCKGLLSVENSDEGAIFKIILTNIE
ncbi:MAG: hypothetical protein DRG78_12295 [Epsilonproteobacteria bacterium]|nr:MAG: hypothetical protein DRG78_12295 [Campylobacterota bacterium]